MNDAIEEWVKVNFCELPTEHEPSAEWEAAGHTPSVDREVARGLLPQVERPRRRARRSPRARRS